MQDDGPADQRARDDGDWRLWGPYLAERAWGTVREDYSPDGSAWEYFDHNQAHRRAYRWSEDGLAGICDYDQRLCFALALWNERDPILKERAFGVTGPQGNHGEDVKEYYFHLDATPDHRYLRYLYKYPQGVFPYAQLVDENQHRSAQMPAFGLLDSAAFDAGHWDVEVIYAKAIPTTIHIRITATNQGHAEATLHLVPQLWFRNTWSWDDDSAERPCLRWRRVPAGAGWAVKAEHPTLGDYHCYGAQDAELLFTENDSNFQVLWGVANPTPYVKDAFHRRIISGQRQAVHPAGEGTKCGAWSRVTLASGASAQWDLVLSTKPLAAPFTDHETVLADAARETDVFYDERFGASDREAQTIARQALAGLIWNQQFYHYPVSRWLDGDAVPSPAERNHGRNKDWRHLRARDVISMPDTWEYPWFAAWDLAYQAMAWGLVDLPFAKHQLALLLGERYLHPNGQVPAYEWAFSDTNPPVQAMVALDLFRREQAVHGEGDLGFLERVFHKLLLNDAWWFNRHDQDGHNIFEGGFLGLDNISVFDRSQHPLPPGYRLKQADATGWMAMLTLNLTVMALELNIRDNQYEDTAIQLYEQFLGIANAMGGHTGTGVSLWDPDAGFFKDLVMAPDGQHHRIDVYSWVGLIPLFACEVVGPRLLDSAPRFRQLLAAYRGGMFDGHTICACPASTNEQGEHLLALVDHTMLPAIVERLFQEAEFLSPYGIRSLSRRHAVDRDLGTLPGVGCTLIDYMPGESDSPLFGGNSNWRGPVWMPTNFSLIQALDKFHRYLGDGFQVALPCLGHRRLSLQEAADLLAERLVALYRLDGQGCIPAYREDHPMQHDPAWQGQHLFYEYFHAETGQGLGAAHQTGWTALLANLVARLAACP